MAKNKSPVRRREPDFSAKSAEIEADSINAVGNGKFRRSGVHHAGRARAEGNVRIRIREQFANTGHGPKRPPSGSILEGEKAEIQSRKLAVVKSGKKSGPDRASASRGVWIFGKLRRRRRWPPTGGE